MVPRPVLLGLIATAACGRGSFEPIADAGRETDAVDGAMSDSGVDVDPACYLADDRCTYGCDGIDEDCTTTCGDGICVGNANEFCGNCAADCATREPVCGNGACDAGESPWCYADCGPSPWPWGGEEAMLLAKINEVRATGYACPNGAKPAVGMLAVGPYVTEAREWAWEIAHQKYGDSNSATCNGRSFNERSGNGALYATGLSTGSDSATTVDVLFARWLSSASFCDVLLDAQYTVSSTALAHENANSYVLLLK